MDALASTNDFGPEELGFGAKPHQSMKPVSRGSGRPVGDLIEIRLGFLRTVDQVRHVRAYRPPLRSRRKVNNNELIVFVVARNPQSGLEAHP
ncbi:MAG: hypothetical protein KAZ88_13440 [Acidimicrobiia bacterium]|jgi:hypothetical protein|nr:hypothetical protein [Acidimicrobiia bacterium]